MKYWIWLSTIKCLGSIRKKKLLEIYDTPKKIYNADIDSIKSTKILKEREIEEFQKSKNIELIRKYKEYIETHAISLINITDKNYPKNLKEIYDPPITLFAKGNMDLLNMPSIAIIGCRNATNYGLNTSKKLAYDLAKENIVIVSGLAKGIDATAHIGAINANGNTIAVLGSGVDMPYPVCNIEIYKQILKKGLVISEYIVGTKPLPEHFPARNRIISGLSSGVVVVEAKKNSGSMITVDFALDQGKNVYAVPGNINLQNSIGTNELIKDGAKIITTYEDILEDFR